MKKSMQTDLIHSKQGSNNGKNTLNDMIKKLQGNINREQKEKVYFTAETLNTFPLDVNLMTGNKKQSFIIREQKEKMENMNDYTKINDMVEKLYEIIEEANLIVNESWIIAFELKRKMDNAKESIANELLKK